MIASFALFLNTTKKQRKLLLKNENLKGVDELIGKVFNRVLKEGDFKGLDFMLDRTIGKVVHKIEPLMPAPTIITRLNGDTIELGSEPKQIKE